VQYIRKIWCWWSKTSTSEEREGVQLFL